jgi:hypothetical protein
LFLSFKTLAIEGAFTVLYDWRHCKKTTGSTGGAKLIYIKKPEDRKSKLDA